MTKMMKNDEMKLKNDEINLNFSQPQLNMTVTSRQPNLEKPGTTSLSIIMEDELLNRKMYSLQLRPI